MAGPVHARAISMDFHDSSDDEAILYEDVDESDNEPHLLIRNPARPAHPHPIRSMQRPFEESIADSARQIRSGIPPFQFSDLTAEERRERLLSGEEHNDTYNAKWKEDPRSRHHPLSKVIAQIAYGVHLLHNQMAISDGEVVRILQRHIDEVDEFIRRADEDLGMALADIEARASHLKFALEDTTMFDIMLEDRKYRLEILQGNDLIEELIKRTANLMNDLMTDIRYGMEGIQDMSAYMARIGTTWPTNTTDLGLYNTMVLNTEGWLECFQSLKHEGESLGAALMALGGFVNQMAVRAGAASRKAALAGKSMSPTGNHSPSLSDETRPYPPRGSSHQLDSKPLPQGPDALIRAFQNNIPAAPAIPKDAPNPTLAYSKSIASQKSDSSSQYKRKTSLSSKRATAISDKRASTATIASLFVAPAAEDAPAVPELPKEAKVAKKSIIPKIPRLTRPRRISITEKFSFTGRTRSESNMTNRSKHAREPSVASQSPEHTKLKHFSAESSQSVGHGSLAPEQKSEIETISEAGPESTSSPVVTSIQLPPPPPLGSPPPLPSPAPSATPSMTIRRKPLPNSAQSSAAATPKPQYSPDPTSLQRSPEPPTRTAPPIVQEAQTSKPSDSEQSVARPQSPNSTTSRPTSPSSQSSEVQPQERPVTNPIVLSDSSSIITIERPRVAEVIKQSPLRSASPVADSPIIKDSPAVNSISSSSESSRAVSPQPPQITEPPKPNIEIVVEPSKPDGLGIELPKIQEPVDVDADAITPTLDVRSDSPCNIPLPATDSPTISTRTSGASSLMLATNTKTDVSSAGEQTKVGIPRSNSILLHSDPSSALPSVTIRTEIPRTVPVPEPEHPKLEDRMRNDSPDTISSTRPESPRVMANSPAPSSLNKALPALPTSRDSSDSDISRQDSARGNSPKPGPNTASSGLLGAVNSTPAPSSLAREGFSKTSSNRAPPPRSIDTKSMGKRVITARAPDSAFSITSNFPSSTRDTLDLPSRPMTSRSMKPTSKLALFPNTSPSMVDLRLRSDAGLSKEPSMQEMEGGIGEEADSALPGPPPRLIARARDGGKPIDGGSVGMGKKLKKLMGFGRRGAKTVDVS